MESIKSFLAGDACSCFIFFAFTYCVAKVVHNWRKLGSFDAMCRQKDNLDAEGGITLGNYILLIALAFVLSAIWHDRLFRFSPLIIGASAVFGYFYQQIHAKLNQPPAKNGDEAEKE